MGANRWLAPLTFSMFPCLELSTTSSSGESAVFATWTGSLPYSESITKLGCGAGEESMQNKTHGKSIRSIRCGIEFPICLHPTRSSAGEDGRARSLHIDDIAIFDRNPHFDVPSNMHLQCRRWIGRARTPQQETASWAAIPGPGWCACGTAFDRARNAIRVRMTGTGRSIVRL